MLWGKRIVQIVLIVFATVGIVTILFSNNQRALYTLFGWKYAVLEPGRGADTGDFHTSNILQVEAVVSDGYAPFITLTVILPYPKGCIAEVRYLQFRKGNETRIEFQHSHYSFGRGCVSLFTGTIPPGEKIDHYSHTQYTFQLDGRYGGGKYQIIVNNYVLPLHFFGRMPELIIPK